MAKVRWGQHQAAVRKGLPSNNHLAQHAHTERHQIDWDGARVLATETRWKERKLVEHIQMELAGTKVISQPTARLSDICLTLFRTDQR